MSKRIAKQIISMAVAVVAGATAFVGCSNGDAKPKAKELVGTAKVSPQAGKAPFEAEFSYEVTKSAGDVKVKWDFADGTTSRAMKGTHKFVKPDFYAVSLEATDEAGNEDNWSLIVRAHDPKTPALSELPDDPKKKADALRNQVKDSVLLYYTKYPSALPSDPKSDFYTKVYPYLKPVYEKNKKLIQARARAQREYSKKQQQKRQKEEQQSDQK